jgi:hypothetical protein
MGGGRCAVMVHHVTEQQAQPRALLRWLVMRRPTLQHVKHSAIQRAYAITGF